jgi:hypothetical protein
MASMERITTPTEAEVEALRVISDELSVKHDHAVADAKDATAHAIRAENDYYDADVAWATAYEARRKATA